MFKLNLSVTKRKYDSLSRTTGREREEKKEGKKKKERERKMKERKREKDEKKEKKKEGEIHFGGKTSLHLPKNLHEYITLWD